MDSREKMWHLYVVRCKSGALYTGIALDVDKRIAEHNAGKRAKAVKALGLPVKLEYQLGWGSKSRALKAEAWFKSLSKEGKEKLIRICVAKW